MIKLYRNCLISCKNPERKLKLTYNKDDKTLVLTKTEACGMKNRLYFEGKIILKNKNHITIDLFNYKTSPYEYDFHSLMMTSFAKFKFSKFEKIRLSTIYRKKINHFLNINLFELKADSDELIAKINQSNLKNIIIQASNYGAYVCLVALHSGKLNRDINIEFELKECPVKLFPDSFIKKHPFKNHHCQFVHESTCWTNKIKSMQCNEIIHHKLKKAA